MPIARIIEIKSLPEGTPPESVRKAWIGCVMPCYPECGHIPVYAEDVGRSRRKGPLTVTEFLALPPAKKVEGYSVPQDIALQVLAVHSPITARWFEQNGYPHPDMDFRFRHDEVTVLRTMNLREQMTSGPIVRYDDMETGTPRRMI